MFRAVRKSTGRIRDLFRSSLQRTRCFSKFKSQRPGPARYRREMFSRSAEALTGFAETRERFNYRCTIVFRCNFSKKKKPPRFIRRKVSNRFLRSNFSAVSHNRRRHYSNRFYKWILIWKKKIVRSYTTERVTFIRWQQQQQQQHRVLIGFFFPVGISDNA